MSVTNPCFDEIIKTEKNDDGVINSCLSQNEANREEYQGVTDSCCGQNDHNKNPYQNVMDSGCSNIGTTEKSNEIKHWRVRETKRGEFNYDDRITDYKKRGEEGRKESWEKWGDSCCWYKRICAVCNFVFYPKSPRAKYCSQRCTNDAYLERRRQRKKFDLENHFCKTCGKKFTAQRKDEKYCTDACKQKAYRKRKECAA
jgi:predicted nucleic acid-binding Zn ribbon protein